MDDCEEEEEEDEDDGAHEALCVGNAHFLAFCGYDGIWSQS